MKKVICILTTIIMVISLYACGNSTEANISNQYQAETSNADLETNTKPVGETVNEHLAGEQGNKQTDILDLTKLSSTMVYAEVNNIMVSPDEYIGRTIKMSGQFAVYAAAETGPFYYACIIADATACCQQGIEFVLTDESLNYPEDYPKIGATITVIGEFQTYLEDDVLYCHLINAELEYI